MRHRLLPLLAALSLALTGCSAQPAEKDDAVHILATTYPVYLFTTAVTQDVQGIEVDLLVNAQTSCLHDYTLTVQDMKAIDAADVIIMSGAGLEDFMEDALGQSDATVIDCSQAVELLPTLEHTGHDGHDHDEEYDPHYWMDPHRAGQVVERIAEALSALDPDNAGAYADNGDAALTALARIDPTLRDAVLPPYSLITFHDGFQYLAHAFGLELVKAIEEEEGATASAREIGEVSALVEERGIAAIFTEVNGPTATARAIARETGCDVAALDMLMSGEGAGIQPYIDAMNANLSTVREALG